MTSSRILRGPKASRIKTFLRSSSYRCMIPRRLPKWDLGDSRPRSYLYHTVEFNPSHQKATCITQSTSGPSLVHIWSRILHDSGGFCENGTLELHRVGRLDWLKVRSLSLQQRDHSGGHFSRPRHLRPTIIHIYYTRLDSFLLRPN